MEQTADGFFPETRPVLRSFQVLEYDSVYSRRAHGTHGHELLYVLDGRMTLHVGERLRFHAVPGDFLLIPDGTVHRDEFAPLRGLRILFAHFDWDAPDYFRTVDNKALLRLSGEARSEARRRLDFLREHWRDTELLRRNAELQLHAILMLFYFDILENASGERRELPREPAAETMRRVKHWLDRNYSLPVTLRDAAEYAGLSPSHLSRRFRREYGIGFSAYLTTLRLEAARHLLRNTSLQTGEVAQRCGFNSASYFIRVFAKRWGVTPKSRAQGHRKEVSPK